jgi:hypothetical protein
MKQIERIILVAWILMLTFSSCIDKEEEANPPIDKDEEANPPIDKNKEVKHCNNSFDPATWDSCNYVSFEANEIPIKILDYERLPYVENSTAVKKKEFYDVDSVPLHSYRGRLNYHPVYIAQYALKMLDVFITTQDSLYLRQLEKITDKLVGTSLEIDSAIFFPYTFNFPLHGCKEETMLAPWYSGMAQGQILSLYCRLYEVTNEIHYLEVSHKIFNSFTRLKGEGNNPWVSCVDKNGNLWLEEYPRDLPCFTLNGKVFAIYGIYDYYRVTKDKYAEKILIASITTIRDNIHRFRNENDVSWYCLKHNNFHGQYTRYHKIHIDQLSMLYEITGDTYFKKMADKFENDTENM